jgi:hypothetical protein
MCDENDEGGSGHSSPYCGYHLTCMHMSIVSLNSDSILFLSDLCSICVETIILVYAETVNVTCTLPVTLLTGPHVLHQATTMANA